MYSTVLQHCTYSAGQGKTQRYMALGTYLAACTELSSSIGGTGEYPCAQAALCEPPRPCSPALQWAEAPCARAASHCEAPVRASGRSRTGWTAACLHCVAAYLPSSTFSSPVESPNLFLLTPIHPPSSNTVSASTFDGFSRVDLSDARDCPEPLFSAQATAWDASVARRTAPSLVRPVILFPKVIFCPTRTTAPRQKHSYRAQPVARPSTPRTALPKLF